METTLEQKAQRIATLQNILDEDYEYKAVLARRKKMEDELETLKTQVESEKAKALLPEALKSVMYSHEDKGNGYFERDIYACQGDAASMETIKKFIESYDPMSSFEDWVNENFDDEEENDIDEIEEGITEYLSKHDIDTEHLFEGLIRDYITDHVGWNYPEDHFLNQMVRTDIIIDSGDANYDYSINAQYPGNAERPAQPGEEGYKPYDPEEFIPKEAGIAWLASTQGYTRGQLHKALLDDDILGREQKEDYEKYYASVKSDPKWASGVADGSITDEDIQAVYTKERRKTPFVPSFLASMNDELRNCSSSTPCVTFLVNMTLGRLLKLQELIKMQDRNGKNYDATKNPDCGTLILGKETRTGLFDLISGGGSCNFDICLEKDVEIPIRFIRSATPDIDDCHGIQWCVGNVYGFIGNVWKETVKNIAEPAA